VQWDLDRLHSIYLSQTNTGTYSHCNRNITESKNEHRISNIIQSLILTLSIVHTSYAFPDLYLEEPSQDLGECSDSFPSLFVRCSRVCESEVTHTVSSNGMFTMRVECPSWSE